MKPQQKLSSAPKISSLLLLLLSVLAAPSFSQSKPSTATFDSLAKQAAAARDSNQLDQAVTLYKKALVLRPKWAEGWWSLGTLEYDRNNYPAAAHAFRQLLPLAPKDGTARVFLGLCEFELGNDADALKHIEEGKVLGVADNPDLRKVMLFHDGLLMLRAEKFKSAESSFRNLCTENFENDQIVLHLGLAVLRIPANQGPPPDSPGSTVVRRVGQAACFAAKKQYDKARQGYSALLQEYPAYPNIHYAFGRFLIELNDTTHAIEEFQRELQNNPENVIARLEIAAAYYKVDSVAGLPYAEQAVQMNPHLPFAHYLLGLLYLDTNDYQKSIPELEMAQKAFPKEAKIYFALGSAYSRAGRKNDAAKARATFERLSQASPANSLPSY